MIKAILKIGLIILIVAAAYYLLVLNAPITWQSAELGEELQAEKCIGSDGKTYYGERPSGIACEQQEQGK